MARVRGALPLVLSLLVVVGAVALLAYSSTLNPIDALLGRGAVVTVPDVVGRSLPRATTEIEDAGLVVEEVSAFSLSVPRGSVIQQDPAAGERVRQGEAVELVISRGANRVEMPDAVGKPVDEVSVPLVEAGVPLDIVEVADEKIPAGIVVAQDPDPGVMVTGDDTPRFEVSGGPAERPVPEVVGLSVNAASFELGEAGFAVGDLRFVDDANVPVGAVASTDPPIGTVLDRDAVVALELSAGPPPVPMPRVTDMTRAAAVDQLESLGYLVSTVGRLVAVGDPGDGRVLDQFPATGTGVRPGQSVTIVVGRPPPAPPPTTTTTTTTTTAPPPPPLPGTPPTTAPGGGG